MGTTGVGDITLSSNKEIEKKSLVIGLFFDKAFM